MSIMADLQKAEEMSFSLEAILTEGFTELHEGDDLFLELLYVRKKVTEIRNKLWRIEKEISILN